MPTYERETTVDSPFDDVWAFHSQVSGLEAVTPDWLDLRVERVIGPDGERIRTCSSPVRKSHFQCARSGRGRDSTGPR